MNTPNPVPKRIFRSRNQRMIAGVCGGIAEYFNVDVTWVRLAFLLLFFLGLGIMAIVYIVMWIVVPDAPNVV